MTTLTKQVKRKVDGLLRKPLTVTLYPGGVIGFRESRSHTEYTLPLMTCYKYAVMAAKAKEGFEKKRKKSLDTEKRLK